MDLSYARFAGRFFKLKENHYWHILPILQTILPCLSFVKRDTDRTIARMLLARLMAWIFALELSRNS